MSASIRTYAESSHPLIVVGDRKTPRDWPQFEMSKNRYIPIEQHGCFEVGRMMPENHYARKNVGYVSAMIDNPDVIFDTDDDNAPNGHWREPPAWECERCISIDAPYNAYKNFTAQSIWPRGFPLDLASYPLILEPIERHMRVGIWQMLANRSPDVDAVWRLMGDIPIEFALGEAFALDMGTWCPTNSQSTFWHKDVFPLLYLPSTVSSRFCDILRGYVAQRIMWSEDPYVGWGGPIVHQDRNPHNLTHDFWDEAFMYTHVWDVLRTLDKVDLSNMRIEQKLWRCYHDLLDAGIVKRRELVVLDAWMCDLQQLGVVA